MFYRVQDYSFANIDKFSASSIITRMTTDVTNVQNAFQMIIRIAVRCPAMLIFALVMAFSVNAELALVFLVTTPILGIGLFIMMKSAFPVFNRVFKKYDNLNRIVQENLRGIRVVKSVCPRGLRNRKVQGRIGGYLPRIHSRREDTRFQRTAHAACRVRLDTFDIVVRSQPYNKGAGRRGRDDDGTAYEHDLICLADTHEPHDGVDGAL